jgi:hypothetical protein
MNIPINDHRNNPTNVGRCSSSIIKRLKENKNGFLQVIVQVSMKNFGINL